MHRHFRPTMLNNIQLHMREFYDHTGKSLHCMILCLYDTSYTVLDSYSARRCLRPAYHFIVWLILALCVCVCKPSSSTPRSCRNIMLYYMQYMYSLKFGLQSPKTLSILLFTSRFSNGILWIVWWFVRMFDTELRC
jgi:hypothetical protein